MFKNLSLAALIVSGLLGLAACDNDGPAEELGETIDEAAEDLKDAIDN